MFDKFCTWIKHTFFTVNAIFICLCIIFWMYGCQSQTPSPTNPERLVNRDTLIAEVESFNARVTSAVSDLDQQDAVKLQLLDAGRELAENGKVSTGSLLLLLGNILGVGAVFDNKRKDTIIKTLKSNGNSTGTNSNT